MARPTYKFDQKDARFVATLTKYGVAVADIARELDVDPKTLQRHFGEIIATAVAYGGQLKTMPCGNVRKQEALERRSRCGIEWYAQTGRNEISAGLSGQKRRMNKRELTGLSEAVGQTPAGSGAAALIRSPLLRAAPR